MDKKLFYAVAALCIASLNLSFGQSSPIQPTSGATAADSFDVYRHTARNGRTYTAALPKSRAPTDYTPAGFVKQPSFVRGSGSLNKREHSLLFYADGDVLPPAMMLGYRYGLLYWWNVGLDVGGMNGVFQAFARTRIENVKIRKTESFFWSNELSAGFKRHVADFGADARFDDQSLVATIDNSLAYRLGPTRRKALYLLTIFYVDYDLHTPRRQTDYYLIPAMAGFEAMAGEHANFFIELGAAYSFNGMQFADASKLFEKSWFPTVRIGLALRTGAKTAIYYTRETKPLSRGKQPKDMR